METIETDILIIGGGPGGYTAAFEAAKAGKQVLLVEKEGKLGGVCLHRGCIPSKTYLTATEIIEAARRSQQSGIRFDPPRIDVGKLRQRKDETVEGLAEDLTGLAEKLGVRTFAGRAYLEGNETVRVEDEEGQREIRFEHLILAVGSRPILPDELDIQHPRVMSSNEALDLGEVPDRLLVVGGNYIGMELGSVYSRLGSSVVVAEVLDRVLSLADEDLAKPVVEAAESSFEALWCETQVAKLATDDKKIRATLDKNGEEREELFDQVLVAVGRRPNTDTLGVENTELELDDRDCLSVNEQQQTNVKHIYAIGDVCGGMMLAHEAEMEARRAVDAICGHSRPPRELLIPAVVYTDPELAWVGVTEQQAKERELQAKVVSVPWSHSGRARSMNRSDGLTKLVIDPASERILGVGICGKHAGELIAEGVLAIEMAATAHDLRETSHPHPTLSETMRDAAARFGD
ncbi:MAG: dihydrolipoyl dehydrogenase [Akkermansiaceae bacterium]|nr:dihydrolipoyl dehydrogenase [Akkermansiaceae bacterium]